MTAGRIELGSGGILLSAAHKSWQLVGPQCITMTSKSSEGLYVPTVDGGDDPDIRPFGSRAPLRPDSQTLPAILRPLVE